MTLHFTKNGSRAITLIELLIVIAILAILMALLTTVLARSRQQRRIFEATQMLESMAVALKKLKEDHQWEWPLAKSEDGTRLPQYFDSNEFAKELAPAMPQWAASYSARLNKTKTAYMEFKQHELNGAAVVDPWGTVYRYVVFADESNRWPYEVDAVYSAGPDKRPFTADDLMRVLSRQPVPASKNDSANPDKTLADLTGANAWIAKPAEWK